MLLNLLVTMCERHEPADVLDVHAADMHLVVDTVNFCSAVKVMNADVKNVIAFVFYRLRLALSV